MSEHDRPTPTDPRPLSEQSTDESPRVELTAALSLLRTGLQFLQRASLEPPDKMTEGDSVMVCFVQVAIGQSIKILADTLGVER